MSDIVNEMIFAMIAALRGGPPSQCDFCGQPYSAERWPVPEEAGEWACNECCERWQKEDEQCWKK